MSTPTPLGTDGYLGGASLYDAGAPVSSPLTFVTTADIPASTPFSPSADFKPVALFVICQVAPVGYAGHDSANAGELYTIDDGLGNTYEPMPNGGGGGERTYGFGSPSLNTFSGFQDGETEQAFPNVGGASFYVYKCIPDVAIPAGTTITVAFPGPGSDPEITWAAVTMLGWQNTDPPGGAWLSARGVDSADNNQGSGGSDPLSDWLLEDFLPGDGYAGFAFVFAFDCPGSLDGPAFACAGDAIDGTQTIDDLGGQWTKVDSGGASATSFYGGLIYAVYTIDSSVATLTEQFDQFIVDPFGDGQHPGGIVAFNLLFDQALIAAGPAFNKVIPV